MLARAPLLPPRHASIFVLETNEKSGVNEAWPSEWGRAKSSGYHTFESSPAYPPALIP
jgi:hypothetical protein